MSMAKKLFALISTSGMLGFTTHEKKDLARSMANAMCGCDLVEDIFTFRDGSSLHLTEEGFEAYDNEEYNL